MTQKQLLMAGGAAVVVGGLAIFALRNRVASASQVPASVQGLGVPTMPSASIPPPAINIADTPYFQNFNFPGDRAITPPPPDTSCPCKGKCDSGLGIGAVVTPAQSLAYLGNIRGATSVGIQNDNFRAQFPPSQFPWLYTSGQHNA